MALVVADKTLLNQFVNFDRAQAATGFGAVLRVAQHFGFRFLLAGTVALIVFGYVRGGPELGAAAASMKSSRLRLKGMLGHAFLLCCLMPLSSLLYRDGGPLLPLEVVVTLWLAAALAAVGLAMWALAPWRVWGRCARALGNSWAYAFVAAIIGVGAMQLSQRLWEPTASLTFYLVARVLLPLIPTLSSNPSTRILSTDQFSVQISDACSGLEGMGLVLAFTTAWLIYFRREYYFPRALLLIPLGLLAIFMLNVARIAGLMLIGHAGYPDTAIFGFHSQAGWITFNCVACGIAFWSRWSGWFNRTEPATTLGANSENPTATYLMPLLAILFAAMLSHAMSGNFETSYPLRLIAGALTLVYFRRELAAIDWTWTWRGVAVGIAAFVFWVLYARYLLAPLPMPAALGEMSPVNRGAWEACRTAAAIFTVPIAEELAYRGYLMRRLMQPEFELRSFKSVRWPAVFLAALIFGVAHGSMWFPAAVVGIAYGLLSVWRGGLGEAVAAHATTNLLIASTVLLNDRWELW